MMPSVSDKNTSSLSLCRLPVSGLGARHNECKHDCISCRLFTVVITPSRRCKKELTRSSSCRSCNRHNTRPLSVGIQGRTQDQNWLATRTRRLETIYGPRALKKHKHPPVWPFGIMPPPLLVSRGSKSRTTSSMSGRFSGLASQHLRMMFAIAFGQQRGISGRNS